MNKKTLLSTLNDLGLTKKEAQVYLTALSLGPTTVLALSRATELKRTTIYSVFESLRQKALMSTEVRGWKKLCVAEDPQCLDVLLADKKEKLSRSLPELNALYNLKGGESFVKYYEGLAATKTIYDGLLKDIRPHEDYLIMANMDEWLKLDREYLLDFTERRAELARGNDISIRMLIQDSPFARTFKKKEKFYCVTVKFLPVSTKLSTNLVIIPKKIVIHQLTTPVKAMIIENKSIIQMHREMFEIMWSALV